MDFIATLTILYTALIRKSNGPSKLRAARASVSPPRHFQTEACRYALALPQYQLAGCCLPSR
jgi:hypothetical protein